MFRCAHRILIPPQMKKIILLALAPLALSCSSPKETITFIHSRDTIATSEEHFELLRDTCIISRYVRDSLVDSVRIIRGRSTHKADTIYQVEVQQRTDTIYKQPKSQPATKPLLDNASFIFLIIVFFIGLVFIGFLMLVLRLLKGGSRWVAFLYTIKVQTARYYYMMNILYTILIVISGFAIRYFVHRQNSKNFPNRRYWTILSEIKQRYFKQSPYLCSRERIKSNAEVRLRTAHKGISMTPREVGNQQIEGFFNLQT